MRQAREGCEVVRRDEPAQEAFMSRRVGLMEGFGAAADNGTRPPTFSGRAEATAAG